MEFLSENDSVRSVLDESEYSNLIEMLTELLLRLKKMEWSSFRGWKEVFLLNSAVEKFRSEVSRKTGTPAKPTTTGFGAYAINRLKIEASALQILKSIQTKVPSECENVGSLGPNKGNLEFRTEFVFQTGNISDSTLKCLQEVTKTLQKEFSTHVQRIAETACTEELFGHIASMNEIEGIEKVKSIYELLMFKRYFAINNQKYSPSSGESSMLMLQKELGEDKDVYILDEPERSLGNEYINDTILPLIQERAKSGKKVFISTHDANIAVRTLPYSSIYRCYDTSGYKTYAGNPFSNHLVCLSDENDLLDWKMVSMKTLEGGEEAFGERGSIYGKS